MRKIFFLLLLLLLLSWPQTRQDSFYLAGIQVNPTVFVDDKIKQQYIDESIPIPVGLQKYIQEIRFVDQKALNEQYSNKTSGYTESRYQNGQCISSIIYLSNENFHAETLLHEVIHVYDSFRFISQEINFIQLMHQEMSLDPRSRILQYYEVPQYESEYLVESILAILMNYQDYIQKHPLTIQYLTKILKEDQIIA